jgi:hypothetical protein
MCYGYTDRETERGLKIQKIITLLGLIIQEKLEILIIIIVSIN